MFPPEVTSPSLAPPRPSRPSTRAESTSPEKPDEEITKLRQATGSRYKVQKRLGGGGMASVYLAEHAQHRSHVGVGRRLEPELARHAVVAQAPVNTAGT